MAKRKRRKVKARAAAQETAAPRAIEVEDVVADSVGPKLAAAMRAVGPEPKKPFEYPADHKERRQLWRFSNSVWYLNNTGRLVQLRAYVCRTHLSVFGDRAPSGADVDLLVMKVTFELERLANEKTGKEPRDPASWRANYEAAMALDPARFVGQFGEVVRLVLTTSSDERSKRSAALKEKFGGTSDGKEEGTDMGKKKTGKKVSIASVVKGILGAAKVPADAAIVTAVKKRFPKSAFKQSHLAWYKSKFRQGALSGMNGKTHVIKQADKPKAKKAPKAKAKKKAKAKAKKKVKARA